MVDPPANPRQKAASELLAELLERVAMPIAASAPRQPSDAATPDQIDLVYCLKTIARELDEFNQDAAVHRQPSDTWAMWATVLEAAARLCRQQVVIDTDEPDVP